MRRVMVLLVAVVAATLLASGVALTQPSGDGTGRYIVVLNDGVDNPGEVASNIARRNDAQVGFVYKNAIKGFSAVVPNNRVDEVRSANHVDYVERDGTMHATAQTLPWGIDRVDADISSTKAGDGTGTVSGVNAYIIDTGIDRVDADNSSTVAGDGTGTVSGVNAYIIDTGIDASHTDLTVPGGNVNFAGGKDSDCNGHGTHVAGTVAAEDNTQDVVGVAPGAALTGVKVLGCNGSGSTSGVIKGVDWVTTNAQEPAVANMSLGGGASKALDDAVTKSAASGVFYSLAAGNSGANACNSSPARAGKGTNNGIMTTAATDINNGEASFSNYGSCVDIWAPGVSILSTKKGGGTVAYSGTSMASPHTGGTGALYLSSNGGASPTAVETALKSNAVATGTFSKDGAAIRLLNASTY